MKNSDAKDPLNEKERNEQQPETEHKEPLKEEKDLKAERPEPDATVPDQTPQEKIPVSPEEEPLAESEKEDSPSIPVSGSDQLIGEDEEEQKNTTYDDDVDTEDHEDHGIGEEVAALEKELESRKSSKPPEEREPSDEEEVEDEMEPPEEEDENQKGEKKPAQKKVEEQRVNFSLLSKEDLVKLMKEKLDHPGKSNMRRDVEEIKKAFYEKINATIEEKKRNFLEEGGDLENFKPVEDPLEGEMKELLKKYRGLKAEFTRQLEKTKQENYLRKQDILEELRLLMEGQEGFEVTFRKFKDLQKKWFSSGIVPQQNLKDLWDSYNYFVDKFNDYVRINRDLRALDLRKNLELKIQLCQRTEALDKDPNVVQAFKSLQKLHTRWREIGPVPRENRDEIWERFKLATSLINTKHQDYHSKLKESLYKNLERKTDLCEKVEAIASKQYETHGAWVERTNVVLEIQKNWKTIGYAPKKDNNAIYARFRKACDIFFGNKARFYAAALEEQKDNLKLKQEITEKAEALIESQDWKETTTELIRLQKQWKEIGPVPRRESDKLWRRFRGACDTFFNNKSKYFENIDSTFEDNLKEKERLIDEMEVYKLLNDKKMNLKALDSFQTRFDAIGYVPSAKKDWIKDQFRHAQDKLLERIGMDESTRSIYKFRHRVQGMATTPRSEMKLNFERDKLVNKLQQLKSDIGLWENNIGFFKQSDSAEETIHGFNEKIEAAHERIRVLEEKIRILDDMENVN